MNELMGTVYCAINELADKGSVVASLLITNFSPTWTTKPPTDTMVTAKTGNEESFETLVKRYRPRIFALAQRYTRVREDAEELSSRLSKERSSTWTTSKGNPRSQHG